LFSFNKVPQLIKANANFIPGDNQVVNGVNLEAFDPLSHIGQLRCASHLESHVFAIWVQHHRLFGLIFTQDLNVVDKATIDARSYDLAFFLVKASKLN
jgi:hypothetical protein